MAAEDATAPSILADVWNTELQIYVNCCTTDESVFDFGQTYGTIQRQKGVKAKALIKLRPLADQLLKISPSGKVVKRELVAAVAYTLEANKHRKIIPTKSREDACRYIVAQAFPRWVFWNVDCQIARIKKMKIRLC